MNIGNEIHISNEKKAYRKPVIEVVDVDREISLMLNSTIPDEPPTVQGFPETENPTKSDPPSRSTNPFGGGTPEYER